MTYISTVKRNVLLYSIFQTNCKQNRKINDQLSIPEAEYTSEDSFGEA